NLPVHCHLPHRGVLRPVNPGLRHTLAAGLRDDGRIMGIEEDAELSGIQLALVGDARCDLDAVGVIEQDAKVADATNTGLRADRWLAGFDAGITEDAFLGLARLPIVIDLLVGTAGNAHAPTAAFLLINENDSILFALVDGARGAGGHARGVEAVFTEAG